MMEEYLMRCEKLGTEYQRIVAAFLLVGALLAGYEVAAQDNEEQGPMEGKTFFVVHEYRYESGDSEANQEVGQSLCGTRCNSLSDSFANIIAPGGWRLVRIANKQERTIALDNPFLHGVCVCVGEEYRIDWYEPGMPYKPQE